MKLAKQSKDRLIVSIFLVALIVWLVVSETSETEIGRPLAITEKQENLDHSAFSSTSNPRKTMQEWANLPNTPFPEDENSSFNLMLNERTGSVGLHLSYQQRVEIQSTFRRTVLMIRASNFEQFLETFKVYYADPSSINLTERGRSYIGRELTAARALDDVTNTSDFDLIQSYWILATGMGNSNRYFTGIVESESFFELRRFDGLPSDVIPDLFPIDRSKTGQVGRRSSYNLNDSANQKVESLLYLDMRLLFSTSDMAIGYPIGFRYLWSETLNTWVPLFCIEYNNVARTIGIAF